MGRLVSGDISLISGSICIRNIHVVCIRFVLLNCLGIAMFYFMGNTWDTRIMHTVLIVSNLGLFLGEFVCFGWSDVMPSSDGAQTLGSDGSKKFQHLSR